MLEFFNRCESGRIYDERTPLKKRLKSSTIRGPDRRS